MSGSEIFKQYDMFTAELVDNRSRSQKRADKERSKPQQQVMFKLPEILSTGVKAAPIIDTSHLASAPLVLISEDTRSAEEKEAALRQAAQALTQAMFADEPETLVDAENVSQLEEASDQQAMQPLEKASSSPQESAYLAVVEMMREQVTTLWIDKTYQQQFHLQLAGAILAAQAAQLTPTEITAAMQIGKYIGEQQRAAADVKPPTLAENHEQLVATPKECPSTIIFEGSRLRMRRETSKLRRRGSK